MRQQTTTRSDPLEDLIARHWPARLEPGALEARLRLIPQQFPQQPASPRWLVSAVAHSPWPWLAGGGLAAASALAGFAVGVLGLLAPAATLDWAALAYGAL
ncbi:MAG: hypothetical protein AB1651_17385 [Pseudomonadota bacterium]